MGIGFYTYFASRGVPLILLAFAGYLWLFRRPLFRRQWRGILLTLAVALLLAIPLVATVAQETGADARVAEVAVPLVEARSGNLVPLLDHVVRTLSMFHADGDDEFLYNIPHRPVFGPAGALIFWLGVLIALWHVAQPAWRAVRSRNNRSQEHVQRAEVQRSTAAAFLLLWWLAGITPAFLSVPAASLGHTIAAQPATYLLAALPIFLLARRPGWGRRLAPLLALALVATVAARDLPDYFREWPQRGNVRFLYNANAADVAGYLSRRPQPLEAFGIEGLLAGPWERLALQIEMENAGVEEAHPRWFDPRRAILLRTSGEAAVIFTDYPRVERAYAELYQRVSDEPPSAYDLARVAAAVPDPAESVCFRNGLCLLDGTYDAAGGHLHLTWEVARPLDVPPVPLYSKPPPPGVYDGPRLAVFAHLLEGDDLLTGDDGLWVNPETLRPGDVFRQQHHLAPPPESAPARDTRFRRWPLRSDDGRAHPDRRQRRPRAPQLLRPLTTRNARLRLHLATSQSDGGGRPESCSVRRQPLLHRSKLARGPWSVALGHDCQGTFPDDDVLEGIGGRQPVELARHALVDGRFQRREDRHRHGHRADSGVNQVKPKLAIGHHRPEGGRQTPL